MNSNFNKLVLALLLVYVKPIFAQTEKMIFKTKGMQVISYFTENKYDSLYLMFNEPQQAYNSAAALISNFDPLVQKYGVFKEVKFGGYSFIGTQADVSFVVKTQYKIEILVELVFNRTNQKLILYRFLEAFKHYAVPTYAQPEKYNEENIIFAADESMPLKGILALPENILKAPLVIVVPDAGPTDADGVYISKPYKDLAAGLGSNGYAVFRYNKRSMSHGFIFSQNKATFSPLNDVVDDLQAAIDVLKKNPAIDSNRIYLLGHGEGGYFAPYMASKNPFLKGIILMNANANHPLEMMIDQNNYLGKIFPNKKEHFDEDNEKAQIVLKRKVKENTSYFLLPHQIPANYWLWINNYNQVKTAKKLTLPVFIMQGARDYQVDKKNFAIWQKKLKKNANVSFKMYDKMNHLMHEGVGESTFSEYAILQHIPIEVINDLLNWLNKN